jgi:hypothetical protein
MEAMQLHFGTQTELTPDPPTRPSSRKPAAIWKSPSATTGRRSGPIRLEASGEGLEFFPPKTEISVGAEDERRVSLRVFAADGVGRRARLAPARLKTFPGPAPMQDLPMRVVLLPRNRTVAWSADLDGDGSPEWVLESQKVRAIFSSQDGGRWMEFNVEGHQREFPARTGPFRRRRDRWRSAPRTIPWSSPERAGSAPCV